MNPCEIVTLTGFADIFAQFQASCDYLEPDTRRVVVRSRGVRPHVKRPNMWLQIDGPEPFTFARSANAGINAAGRSDVLLVNDDVQFGRHNTVEALRRVAYSHPEVSIVSPTVSGCVGNPLQRKICWGRRDGFVEVFDPPYLAFVCVYIKRQVFDRIGLLDESFTGYGGEDEEFCVRAHRTGFKLAVTTDVNVYHGFGASRSSSSYGRTHGDTRESMAKMRELARKKSETEVTV